MSDKIRVKHGDAVIEYREIYTESIGYREKWCLIDDNSQAVFSDDSLKAVKAKVDDLFKKSKTPVAAIRLAWRHGRGIIFENVLATSMEGFGYAWVKDGKGKRTKEEARILMAYTDENLEILGQIIAHEMAVSELEDEIKRLVSSLTQADLTSIIKPEDREVEGEEDEVEDENG